MKHGLEIHFPQHSKNMNLFSYIHSLRLNNQKIEIILVTKLTHFNFVDDDTNIWFSLIIYSSYLSAAL